jgi:hypothetical protein
LVTNEEFGAVYVPVGARRHFLKRDFGDREITVSLTRPNAEVVDDSHRIEFIGEQGSGESRPDEPAAARD